MRRRTHDEGFTLIELIVAMLVLAIVLLSIITIQARALTTVAEANARQQATTFANEAMEQLRAVPWNVLKRGMASNYLAASGGDSHVGSDVLTVDGVTVALEVAAAGSADQDLDSPWPPLFDETGSHAHVEEDPAGSGRQYTVYAYVTEDLTGLDDAVGLAVVVEWTSREDGDVDQTVLWSTAYAPSGGCGDLNNAPFLASCQASFYGSAQSATVSTTVSAAEYVDSSVGGDQDPVPVVPGSSFYTFTVSTASTSSRISSLQFTDIDANAQYGGIVWDDDDSSTQPTVEGWEEGFENYSLRASNDTVSTDAAPANPTDIYTSGSNTSEDFNSFWGGVELEARSDDSRDGVLDASTTDACDVGVGAAQVPAGQPCASAQLDDASSYGAFVLMEFGGEMIRLSRVRQESGSSVSNTFAGRFVEATAGNGDSGCQLLGGSGCVSAGFNGTLGDVSIGAVIGDTWDGGAAPDGLVTVSNYTEVGMVDRGYQQPASTPTLSRTATIQFWNGAGYSTANLSTYSSDTHTIGSATWTNSRATVEVVDGTISILPGQVTVAGSDPDCTDESCDVTATNGLIQIDVTYLITPDNGSIDPFELTVTTVIAGGTSSASYKEPTDA